MWLVVCGGPTVGALLYLILGKSRPENALAIVKPAAGKGDLAAPPTIRMGIPPDVVARIHDACGGQIKDGELDIRFELRSRRDCDKMVTMLREMKEQLQRTKSVIADAEEEARLQLDRQLAAAKLTTSRVIALVTRRTQPVVPAAHREQYIAAKRAELDGYETAHQLVDRFISELGGAEISVRELPFYTSPDPAPTAPVRLTNQPRVA